MYHHRRGRGSTAKSVTAVRARARLWVFSCVLSFRYVSSSSLDHSERTRAWRHSCANRNATWRMGSPVTRCAANRRSARYWTTSRLLLLFFRGIFFPLFNFRLISASTRKPRIKAYTRARHSDLKYTLFINPREHETRKYRVRIHIDIIHFLMQFKCDSARSEISMPSDLRGYTFLTVYETI